MTVERRGPPLLEAYKEEFPGLWELIRLNRRNEKNLTIFTPIHDFELRAIARSSMEDNLAITYRGKRRGLLVAKKTDDPELPWSIHVDPGIPSDKRFDLEKILAFGEQELATDMDLVDKIHTFYWAVNLRDMADVQPQGDLL